jgi:CelD/BcsL family acetyltransferase involved in cellulose biosynthesis
VTPTLQADPECARPATEAGESAQAEPSEAPTQPDLKLRAELRPFDSIDRETWDRLAFLNPYSTPFSTWAFQRAWWDAYSDNADEQIVVLVDPAAADPKQPVAIAPLMHRHVVEPTDANRHTAIRHTDALPLTPVAPDACAVYFGASYHADYATLLGHPANLPAAAEAVVEHLATDPMHPEPWSIVDLRRLRQADPATDVLIEAFGRREVAEGWTLNIEREDVCPVIRLPQGGDFEAYLATLGKKERHEIRRKSRRAESAGAIELVESTDPVADLDAFIDLHQGKWGDRGLFPDNPGGDQARVFMRRLFELFGDATSGPNAIPEHPTVHLGFLTLDGKRIAAEIHFETAGSLLYYNAGVDMDAKHLSPGVVQLEHLVRRAIDRGKCRVDLLRGNEPYKYEWGAVDEPFMRILVRRTVGGAADGAVA